MSASIRRERHRQQLRAAILDAARGLFLREGFDGFSMRKLAAAIAYSPGSIYVYFKNKEELFDYLVEESFAQLFEQRGKLGHGEGGTDPVALLKQAGRAYVEFGLENPGAYRIAFLVPRPGPVRPWRPHQAFEALRRLVGRCVREKRFRRVDVETASQALWAAFHGVTALLTLRPSFPWVSRDKLIKRVIDSAVDSLVADRPPAAQGGRHGQHARR
jgi:AcrR family transcriptional regulator